MIVSVAWVQWGQRFKRFSIVFDYTNGSMFFRKKQEFSDLFVTTELSRNRALGVQWVTGNGGATDCSYRGR
jgi:hypothetical protein